MRIYFNSLTYCGVPVLWKYRKISHQAKNRPADISAFCLYRTLDGYFLGPEEINLINQHFQCTQGVRLRGHFLWINNLPEFEKKNPFHMAITLYTKPQNNSPSSKQFLFFKEPGADNQTVLNTLEQSTLNF